MNIINPKKLLNSKWTAVHPINKEKHFIVVKVVFDEDENSVERCVIEAVMTKRSFDIDWRLLKTESWIIGWK
ncbi:TIGR02450 family Trp-rich protein [Marinagarivorans cellulosilyticus]|uniref:TIGR02450 family Trp-rich protein n=1 Tax=Marinagarivorans cellulosilyticus TaxID=2721545 RepID=UPI001F1ADAB1|nr:TIGR02450 family Trp-rich protein [Marinagarivorans cellulosilyticus]